MDKNPFKIGIAGLGTVGTGIIDVYQKNIREINKKAGREIILMAVSAQNKNRDRGVVLTDFHWEDNPLSLAERNDIDLIVEVIGGSDGAAKTLIERALQNRKHIVTANKALLANFGENLAKLAEDYEVSLRYEAAVAGGIPIIKVLTESLISNKLTSIYGVINGTCNYILTKMETEGRDYNDVFSEAKRLGYVEADPELDIGGIDSAHKISILSSLAFGTKLDYRNVSTKGIKSVSLEDIKEASNMGFKIKLLARAEYKKGVLEQEVAPCLVKKNTPIAQVQGSTNIVVLEGEDIGETVFSGPGAGMGPTASAVVSDLISIALGDKVPTLLNSIRSSKRSQKGVLSQKR